MDRTETLKAIRERVAGPESAYSDRTYYRLTDDFVDALAGGEARFSVRPGEGFYPLTSVSDGLKVANAVLPGREREVMERAFGLVEEGTGAYDARLAKAFALALLDVAAGA